MKLSPQKKYLLDLYKDGEWKCSTAIQYVRDFRKRISECNREGFTFLSMKCDRRCGIAHASNVHMYKLEDVPTRTVYDYELVNGVRVPRARQVAIIG